MLIVQPTSATGGLYPSPGPTDGGSLKVVNFMLVVWRPAPSGSPVQGLAIFPEM